MIKKLISGLFFVILLAFLACHSKPKAVKKETPKVTEIIVLSVSGREPGITTGWTLSTKGQLIKWEKNLGNALFDETDFQVPAQKVIQIADSLKASGILAMKLNSSGKPTYHLTYKKGEQVVHLSWTDSTQLPASFARWYRETMDWCKAVRQKSKSVGH